MRAGLDTVAVAGTASSQAVIVRNFRLLPGTGVLPLSSVGLRVTQCRGPVTVEDSELVGYANPINPGAAIAASSNVTLVRCRIAASAMQCVAGECLPALLAHGSTLHLQDCTVAGTTTLCASGHGCTAAEMVSATVTATRTVLAGGRGRDGLPSLCVRPGDGGAALSVDGSSRASLLDCSLVPGKPGNQPFSGCPQGRPGPRIAGTGTVVEFAEPSGGILAASPVRHGQRAAMAVTGPVGSVAWLAVAAGRDPVFVLSCRGTLHPAVAGATAIVLGTIPSSGQLSVSFPGAAASGFRRRRGPGRLPPPARGMPCRQPDRLAAARPAVLTAATGAASRHAPFRTARAAPLNYYRLPSSVRSILPMAEPDPAVRKFQKELHAGTISLVLLALLATEREPSYGYRIAKRLQQLAANRLQLKQGTLYPVLRSLEAQDLLESWLEPSAAGPPRKYYRITRRGRRALRAWTALWHDARATVDAILAGADDAGSDRGLSGRAG